MCPAKRLEYPSVASSAGVSRYTSRNACLNGCRSSAVTRCSRHRAVSSAEARTGCHSRTRSGSVSGSVPGATAAHAPSPSWNSQISPRLMDPVSGWSR